MSQTRAPVIGGWEKIFNRKWEKVGAASMFVGMIHWLAKCWRGAGSVRLHQSEAGRKTSEPVSTRCV